MKTFYCAVLTVLSVAVVPVTADTTIRYTFSTSSPLTPTLNQSHPMVIYMKGSQGATVVDAQTTLVDFARQQVTIIDTVRRKYATIPASQYGDKIGTSMAGMMPAAERRDGVGHAEVDEGDVRYEKTWSAGNHSGGSGGRT